ncbi:hypothetical protein [Hallella colorans]|jgi:hypothetical protein|uniref:hypothetical protein n=1 Tax=Hallella colorans TaxID=1703337 RepID=UPI0023F0A8C7|nr:hypothetical protein [Hallella colorans]
MAKKNYVSPVSLVLVGGDPGTGNVPFSQQDPDNPKTGKAKEMEFDGELYDTNWED